MSGGIGPVKLLSLIMNRLRSGNVVKPNLASVPLSCFPERLISETEPAELQIIPVQLQRLVRFVRDQELSNEDEGRLFFHFNRASPCLVVNTVVRVDGSKEKIKTSVRR